MFAEYSEPIKLYSKGIAKLSLGIMVFLLVGAIIMLIPCASMLMGVQVLLIILAISAAANMVVGGPFVFGILSA